MRAELYPRDPQQLGRHATARGDDIGHHQVGRHVTQRGHVEHRHPRGAPVDSGAGVEVVVEGHQPVQRNSVNAGEAGGFNPLRPGEQRRRVARFAEALAQRDRRKRVPGVRPGDNGDAHRPTLPQRPAPTLAP